MHISNKNCIACCVCLFGWLIDVDEDLALIDPTEPFLREEWLRSEGRLQREPKTDT